MKEHYQFKLDQVSKELKELEPKFPPQRLPSPKAPPSHILSNGKNDMSPFDLTQFLHKFVYSSASQSEDNKRTSEDNKRT